MTGEEYKRMLAAMQQRVDADRGNSEAWRDLAQAKMMGGGDMTT